jgi:hypothetical protein
MISAIADPAPDRKTMSVPEAGRFYFGLGVTASYQAAARGEIPTIRIGGRVLAVVAGLEKMLAEACAAAAPPLADAAPQPKPPVEPPAPEKPQPRRTQRQPKPRAESASSIV